MDKFLERLSQNSIIPLKSTNNSWPGSINIIEMSGKLLKKKKL
jgi:tetrahydromethanopterin S-methyltransferase subunit B